MLAEVGEHIPALQVGKYVPSGPFSFAELDAAGVTPAEGQRPIADGRGGARDALSKGVMDVPSINQLPEYISIGRQGEGGVTSIVLDVTPWVTAYPTGVPSATWKAPGAATAPALPASQVVLDGNTLTIHVKRNMTATAGMGTLNVRWVIGEDDEKRSAVIKCTIEATHPATAGEVPDIVQDWVDEATLKLAEVTATEQAAETAEGLRAEAEQGRVTAELQRGEAEQGRAAAEQEREAAYTQAEQDRSAAYVQAEADRDGLFGAQELARQEAETLRAGAEGTRAAAEGQRDSAETARAEAEGLRAAAEQGRQDAYTQAESDRDGLYAAAEQARAELFNVSELARQEAEGLRVIAEAARESASQAAVTAANGAAALADSKATLAQEKADLANAAAVAAGNDILWKRTAGANPVSVHPVPQSPLYPRVTGSYSQAAGTPAPDNILPITSWLANGAQVKVKRTGKNIAPKFTTQTLNGITLTVDADGTCHLTGTSNGAVIITVPTYIPPSTLALSLNNPTAVGATDGYVTLLDSAYNQLMLRNFGTIYNKLEGVATAVPGTMFRIYVATGKTLSDFVLKPQLEIGAIATPYEEYTAEEITLTAPQEIAAGWMNNEGAGQATLFKKVLDGTENFTRTASGAFYVFRLYHGLPTAPLASTNVGAWSHYRFNSSVSYGGANVNLDAYAIDTQFRIRDDRFSTAEEYKTWLAAQYAAGTPVTVYYQLAIPTPLTLTPAPLAALAQADRATPRVNVLTASSGLIELLYAKSGIRESEDALTNLTDKTSYGVVSGLGVTAQGTPNMSVAVAAGVLWMQNGTRFAPAANSALAVTAADATNPRIDIVYVNASGVVAYLAGTAAATPAQPATPAGSLLLATLYVAAGDTAINTADITDRRKSMWTEPWISASLLNSWMGTLQYAKSFDGFVSIAIDLTVGTGTAYTQIALLPVGYRPKKYTVLYASNTSAGTGAAIRIQSNGIVENMAALTAGHFLQGVMTFREATV